MQEQRGTKTQQLWAFGPPLNKLSSFQKYFKHVTSTKALSLVKKLQIYISNNAIRAAFTSQKNSLPRRPQNQEIHDTSSELLIFLDRFAYDYEVCRLRMYEKRKQDHE